MRTSVGHGDKQAGGFWCGLPAPPPHRPPPTSSIPSVVNWCPFRVVGTRCSTRSIPRHPLPALYMCLCVHTKVALFLPFTILACLPFTIGARLAYGSPSSWTETFAPLWLASAAHIATRWRMFPRCRPRLLLVRACVCVSVCDGASFLHPGTAVGPNPPCSGLSAPQA